MLFKIMVTMFIFCFPLFILFLIISAGIGNPYKKSTDVFEVLAIIFGIGWGIPIIIGIIYGTYEILKMVWGW